MSLTANDLQAIRDIVTTEITKTVREEIKPIADAVDALRKDIKEIYDMIAELQNANKSSQSMKKLTLEEKILKMHSELVEAARQAGVTLPSH